MRPAWAAIADLPVGVIKLFYRVRFGGHPLTEPESQTIGAALDRLAETLSHAGRRQVC